MTQGPGGGTVRPMHRLTSLSKYVALFAALAVVGAGTATAAKLITGKQIKNASITGKDLRAKSVAAKHLNPGAKAALQGPAGPQGATGAAGATGPTGPQGERGPSTARAHADPAAKTVTDEASSIVADVTVPKGLYVVQAKATLHNINKPTVGTCSLRLVRGQKSEDIDTASGISLAVKDDPGDTLSVSLLATANADIDASSLELRCLPGLNGELSVTDRVIVATQVSEIK